MVWSKVYRILSAKSVKLSFIAILFLVYLSLSSARIEMVLANKLNLLALRAVSSSEMTAGVDNLWQVQCQQSILYDSHRYTPQMVKMVGEGVCFSLEDWSANFIQSISPAHRYWLAVSVTANRQDLDLETQLWHSLNPPVNYFMTMAMAELTLSNEQAAAYWCRLASVNHPHSARSAYCLGRVAQMARQYEDALYFYELAITDDKDDLLSSERFQLLSRTGHILLDQFNHAEEAVVWFNEALAEIPEGCCPSQVALTFNRVGRILDGENEYVRAFTYHEQALVFSRNPWFLRDAGRSLYRVTDNWQLARPYFEEAFTLAAQDDAISDDVSLWLSLARLYIDAGYHEELGPFLINAPMSVKASPRFIEIQETVGN
jgi:tetratricopeptide (TPR) repeat protein